MEYLGFEYRFQVIRLRSRVGGGDTLQENDSFE